MRIRVTYVLAGLLGLGFLLQVLAAQPLDKFGDFQADKMASYAWTALGVGGVYLGLMFVLRRIDRVPHRLLAVLFMLGLLMRVGAWNAPPTHEDDWFRYLLDGAAAAHGLNPFAVSPEAMLEGDAPAAWMALLDEPGARGVVEKINHPQLRTIYPPVAQLGFAAAYVLDPWGLAGLRAVFQVADLLSLLGVIGLLAALKKPLAWAAVYWCCPLIPMQLIGTAHMDVIAVAAVSLAAMALAYRRPFVSAGLLGVGVAVKLWPLLLVPVFLGRAVSMPWPRRGLVLGVGALVAGVCMAPMALHGFGEGAGFTAYRQQWMNNTGAFAVLQVATKNVLPWLGAEVWYAGQWTRRVVMGLIGCLVLTMMLLPRPRSHPSTQGVSPGVRGGAWAAETAITRGALVLSVAFFLSPTQFPWYATWPIALLAAVPTTGLLAYTALIWLYYLPGQPVWALYLQHAVFAMLLLGWLAGRVFTGWMPASDTGLNQASHQPATDPALRPMADAFGAASSSDDLDAGSEAESLEADSLDADQLKLDDERGQPVEPNEPIRVCAVIPALNERETIGQAVRSALTSAQQVIVADNGSTDGTPQEAEKAGARVVHARRRGYGSACLQALAALAQDPTPPDAVLFLDADGSDAPESFPDLIKPIAHGQADFVLGSRTRGRADPGALTLPQRLGGWMMGAYLRRRYGVAATDMGPCRAIRYDALRRLAMDDQDFGWTIQMQTRAATPSAKVRCAEIPVPYRKRQAGKSKISGTLYGSWMAGRIILTTAWRERHWRPKPAGHVAVLAKMPEPGRVKTRLAKDIGIDNAARIHDRMLRHTLRRAAGFSHTFWYGASSAEPDGQGWPLTRVRRVYGAWRRYRPQPDGDLGTRIQAAFADAFDRGHEAVLVIGGDCPDLTAQDLDHAMQALLAGSADAVLGPAEDGGYWIVGLSRSVWPMPGLTQGIDWSTDNVYKQTCQVVREAGLRCQTLRVLSDVDTLADLAVWRPHDPEPDGLDCLGSGLPGQRQDAGTTF